MASSTKIRALFLDIGGVLLTNGWDTDTRKVAVAAFQLDAADLDSRHRMVFDTYEIGKITLDDYLDRVIFYRPRSFSKKAFIAWMMSQSKAYAEMIAMVRKLKKRHHLKVGVVSNEGRELTEFRIKKFDLASFVDFFVCSSFVHLRKPDSDIYRLALDLMQVQPQHVVYLEDRQLFVEVAGRLGIRGICHKDISDTQQALSRLGLSA